MPEKGISASASSVEFSKESIIKYVKAELGSPPLDIVLSEENYDAAIGDAFDLYNIWVPRIGRVTFPVSKGQTKYALPSEASRPLYVQPQRVSNFLPPASAFSFNLGDSVVFRHIPAMNQVYGVDQINELLMYSNMIQKRLSGDFQYEIHDGHIYVSNLPFGVNLVAIVYAADHNYNTVSHGDRLWMKQYALAGCKVILGRIHSRFPTPGPAGQQLILDGAALLEEGRAEKQMLEDKIRRSGWQIPPQWG